jgi:hypothetical protein
MNKYCGVGRHGAAANIAEHCILRQFAYSHNSGLYTIHISKYGRGGHDCLKKRQIAVVCAALEAGRLRPARQLRRRSPLAWGGHAPLSPCHLYQRSAQSFSVAWLLLLKPSAWPGCRCSSVQRGLAAAAQAFGGTTLPLPVPLPSGSGAGPFRPCSAHHLASASASASSTCATL